MKGIICQKPTGPLVGTEIVCEHGQGERETDEKKKIPYVHATVGCHPRCLFFSEIQPLHRETG